MTKSERDERRARKEERMKRDRENDRGFGSYAIGKHGYEFDFFKPEFFETVRLHILPYVVTAAHPEVKAGRMEVGDEDYFLEYGMHRNMGANNRSTLICLNVTFGEPCPICDHARQLRDEGYKDDLPWPSRRCLYNVAVVGKEDKVMIFEVSEKFFHNELKSKLSRWKDGWFDYSDLEEGKIVEFYVDQDKFGSIKYAKYKDFNFVDRDPLPASMLEKSIPLGRLLNVPTYKEAEALYNGDISFIDFSGSDNTPARDRGRKEDTRSSAEDAPPDDEFEDDDPKEDRSEKSEERRPRGKSESAFAYGDECPQGLVFGKDNDTDRKLCGARCDDATYRACSQAKRKHDES